MTLAQARSLQSDVTAREHDPVADATALEALARHLTRFSPVVAIADTLPQMEAAAPRKADRIRVSRFCQGERIALHRHAPAGALSCPCAVALFLDLTGLDRVFAGLDNLLQQLTAALQKLNLPAALAAAPTPAAAWAGTFAPHMQGKLIEPHQLREVIDDLPPQVMRLDDATLAKLHHLGLTRIGQLRELPRDELPRRFGQSLLLRLDQIDGLAMEPLVPIRPPQPMTVRRAFDTPVVQAEAIWKSLRKLVDQLVRQLHRRGRGVRQLRVTFDRPFDPPIRRTIDFTSPTRDPVNLFNLLRLTAEDLAPRERARNSRKKSDNTRPGDLSRQAHETKLTRTRYVAEGFTAFTFLVLRDEFQADTQVTLDRHESYAGEIELNRLVERLITRLGKAAIVRPQLAESYLPERSWGSRYEGTKARRHEGLPSTGQTGRSASDPSCLRAFVPQCLSPPHSLTHVTVAPSHDRDGRPIQIGPRRIVHAVGPHRIAGVWWEGRNKTRDYFDVEDDTGRRQWIFRVQETGQWYMHGEFT